jgi:NADH-quinone oxidoreductase subunit N
VFVFKVAAVPFQAWAPDAYAASPVPVAAYLSVVSKTAGLGALVVLLSYALLPLARWWGLGLTAVTLATFVVGNAIALRQASLVRLLAWSSVAQLAYVLLPVAAVGLGSVSDLSARSAGALVAAMTDAVSASVGYLVAYAVMTIASWAVVLVVVRRRRPADGVLLIEDVRGLARRSPWIGGSFAFAFACLAGLPPGIVGLVVKVRVFQVAVAAQSWLLVAVAVVATVVALAYYLRVAAVLVAALARAPAAVTVPASAPADSAGTDGAGSADRDPVALLAVVAVTTAALVVTSVFPALVLGWA